MRPCRPAGSRRPCSQRARRAGGQVRSAGARPGHRAEAARRPGIGRRRRVLVGVGRPSIVPKRVATLVVRAPDGAGRRRRRTRSSRPAISSGRCACSASSTTRFCGCGSTSRRSARSCSRPKAIRRWCSQADEVLVRAAGALARARGASHFIKRTLKRLDLSARSFFALIEPGNAFAGTLFELALAADRSYMLDDPDRPNAIQLSGMNAGPLPDEQRALAAAGALLRRAAARGEVARARRAVRRRPRRSKPAW